MSAFRRSALRQQLPPIHLKPRSLSYPCFRMPSIISESCPSTIFTFRLEVNRVLPVKIAEIGRWQIRGNVRWNVFPFQQCQRIVPAGWRPMAHSSPVMTDI